MIPITGAKPLHQFKPRSLVDVCAEVDTTLVISGISFGTINVCLCVSAIPDVLVSGNVILSAAVAKVGAQSVTQSLNNLITTAANNKKCQYPDNCTPICQAGNPCGFECNNGFVASPAINPTTCVCPAPFKVCNGQCGIYTTCGSQPASYPYSKRELELRDMECQPGWKLCKIPGREVLECVDVMNDLWSCGGCELATFDNEKVGTDCTVIPNVAGVSCLAGTCKIESCRRGFRLDGVETSCVPMNIVAPTTPNYPMLVQNGNEPFKA
ncbi:hypothetical protein Clacol_008508 [Clathrus columnatus]|uniref:Protein CPL1-like domain-containing protein n=1 Tax=Clathrus columnatus TaxID=1419009 RepID=A0AAV5ANJ7_9AGAM|nr:hypothetical protein Clacol_008508 [Clathrus columnatus]